MTATPGAFAHHPALLRYLHYQFKRYGALVFLSVDQAPAEAPGGFDD